MDKIAICDAENMTAQAIKGILELNHFESDILPTVEILLSRIAACEYDIVLLDFMVMARRGTDVINQLRQVNPYIHIVLRGNVGLSELKLREKPDVYIETGAEGQLDDYVEAVKNYFYALV